MLVFTCIHVQAFQLTDSDPNSPEFRKRFMASYGVNAAIEPKLTQKDRPLYDKVRRYLESNPRRAINEVESQISSQSNAAFDFLLGNLYYSIDDFSNAERHLDNAIKKFPTFRRAYRTWAIIYVRQQRFLKSIPIWLKVIELGGGDAQSYGLLAHAHLLDENYRSALAAYDLARVFKPDSRDFRRGTAQCLLMTQQYHAAIALFDELLSEVPGEPDYWLFQAEAFIAVEEYKKAIANLEIAHSIDDPKWSSLLLLGDLYMRDYNYSLGFKTYSYALQRYPGIDPEKAFKPLEILMRSNLFEEAQAYYDLFVQTITNEISPELELDMELVQAELYLKQGNVDGAQKKLTKILEADPLSGRALLLMGACEEQQNRLEEAEFYYERTLLLPDYKYEGLQSLGKLYVLQGKLEAAIEYYERAYSLKESAYLKKYIARLSQLLN